VPKAVTIIKIDPEKRKIARISIKPSIQGVRAVIGAAQIGHRVLLDDVDGEKLLVAARVSQDPDKPLPEWRLRGTDNTAGAGFLFGTLNRRMDGMWHCPVGLAWVEREIVWCEPGEVAPAAEVAEVLGIEATPVEVGSSDAARAS
jgi:hypothetical protein